MMRQLAYCGLATGILAAGLILGTAGPAMAETSPKKAAEFVETLGSKAATLLASTKAREPGKRYTVLKDLIRDGFDLELTSQFVLGKYWHRASDEQRAEFKDLFTEYMLNSYARHLSSFRAETLEIVDSHPVGQKDVLVETIIEVAEGMVHPVWRVRAHDDAYRIIDVSVDGVSLALTQRREFASVINRKGLDALLDLLRDKLASQAKAAVWRPARDESHVSLLASILASPNARMTIPIFLAKR